MGNQKSFFKTVCYQITGEFSSAGSSANEASRSSPGYQRYPQCQQSRSDTVGKRVSEKGREAIGQETVMVKFYDKGGIFMRFRIFAVLAILVLVVGCVGCEKDLVKEYGPTVTPKMEAIAKLAEEAEKNSNMTFDWPKEGVDGLDFSDKTGNAIMVMHDDLGDLSKDKDLPVRIATLDRDPFRVTQRVLGKILDGKVNAKDNPSFYEPLVQHLQRAKYALIVVTKTYDLPSIPIGSTDKFRPGKIEAVGLLFEIDKPTLKGAFEFSATNSPELMAKEGAEESKLRNNLSYQCGEALKAAISKRFPTAKVEYFTGFTSW